MSIHKYIREQNFKSFKENLNDDNVNLSDSYGDTPVEVLVKNFNNTTKLSIAKLMTQILINNGADMTRIKPYVEEKLLKGNLEPSIHSFYTFLQKTKLPSKNTTNKSINSSKNRSFKSALGNKKSDYSAQEELQLRKIASSLNLSTINTNHLALRIINHLKHLKQCPECGTEL